MPWPLIAVGAYVAGIGIGKLAKMQGDSIRQIAHDIDAETNTRIKEAESIYTQARYETLMASYTQCREIHTLIAKLEELPGSPTAELPDGLKDFWKSILDTPLLRKGTARFAEEWSDAENGNHIKSTYYGVNSVAQSGHPNIAAFGAAISGLTKGVEHFNAARQLRLNSMARHDELTAKVAAVVTARAKECDDFLSHIEKTREWLAERLRLQERPHLGDFARMSSATYKVVKERLDEPR